MQKKAPFIFLFALTVVLIFIVGVRYGQHVEKTSKENAYMISLTPPPTKAAPTMTEVKYVLYSHKPCGVQFVVPNTLDRKESSVSAVFISGNQKKISISCDKNASGSAKINPYTGRRIVFTVSEDLKNLVERSITFLR